MYVSNAHRGRKNSHQRCRKQAGARARARGARHSAGAVLRRVRVHTACARATVSVHWSRKASSRRPPCFRSSLTPLCVCLRGARPSPSLYVPPAGAGRIRPPLPCGNGRPGSWLQTSLRRAGHANRPTETSGGIRTRSRRQMLCRCHTWDTDAGLKPCSKPSTQ